MKSVSSKTLWRLQVQGYAGYSPEELAQIRFGNRFAYVACGTIVALGVYFVHIPTLAIIIAVAFLGVVLPYHPFDYIYNYLLRFFILKPALPRRALQIKFACVIATIWLLATLYLFQTGDILAGQILGGLLVGVAYLVGFTDICLPSIIYNIATKLRVNPNK